METLGQKVWIQFSQVKEKLNFFGLWKWEVTLSFAWQYWIVWKFFYPINVKELTHLQHALSAKSFLNTYK